MKKTANTLKKAFSLLLCICLMASLCTVAAAEGTTSVGKISQSYVSGEGAAKTYKAEVKVYNYSDTPMNALLLTVLMEGKIIKNVVSTPVKNITGGKTISHNITTTAEGQEPKSFIWTSFDELKPIVTNKTAAPPTNVSANTETITNSTVDLTWTASEDSDAVEYYKVYRDGKEVGKTAGAVESFKDVGIEDSTEVTYTVSAVDYAGNEGAKSAASASVTTDAIASLWLGAAASEIADGQTSATLEATDYDKVKGNGNIEPVHIMLSDGTNSTTVDAVSEEYEFVTDQRLGLSALKFGPNLSRVLATIPTEEFLTALKNDANKEIKVIMNYYDYPETRDASANFNVNIGKRVAAMIRYQYSTGLSGGTGTLVSSSNKWHTSILTVPLSGNNTEGTYSDVYDKRQFGLQAISSNSSAIAGTDGKSAMLAIGNGTVVNPVYISKVDIAGSDYVPYGAVLDFENQGDSQFVHFIRRSGYNPSEIKEMTSSADSVSKKAYKLDAVSGKQLHLAFDEDYIKETDKDIIVRVTYLDNKKDESNGEGLQLVYRIGEEIIDGKKKTITNGTNYIRREGTGKWQTAEFKYINDAALTTAWDSLMLNVPEATGENAFYVSRVEVINRNPN